MTGRPRRTAPDLSELPAAVWAEAVEAARADAVAELRSRIAHWLVAAAPSLPTVAGRAGGPERTGPEAAPVPSGLEPMSGPEPMPAPAPGLQPMPEPMSGLQPMPEPMSGPGPEPMPGPGPGPGRRGWYMYGLTWLHLTDGLAALSGVDGAPVEVVPVGRLALVGSWVDHDGGSWGLDVLGDADLAQLEPLVRAHEGVLETLLERGAVLPLRFGRLHPDPGPVRERVEARADTVARALERVAGRAEWGVTLEWHPAGAGPDRDRPPGAHGSGYLAHRRDQMSAAEEAARVARAEVFRVHEALTALADEQAVHPVRRQRGRDRPVIWRASYLVDGTRMAAFRRAAAEGIDDAPPELELSGQLTGPWPPYNFCSADLDAVPA